jgi:glycosyltransferase involved in cell wall biosynthesis
LIKVYFLVSSLARCGPNNIVKAIKDNLSCEYLPYLVVMKQKGSRLEEDDPGLLLGCQVIFLGDFSLACIVRNLISISRSEDNALLHSNCFRGDLASGLAKYVFPGVRVVQTFHNFPYEDYPLAYGAILGRVMSTLTYCFGSRSDLAVACSDSVNTHLVEKGVYSKTVCNGLDVSKLTLIENKEFNQLRLSLGIGIKDFVFGYLGALIPRKRVDLSIEAFKKSGADGKFLVVGGGQEELLLRDKYRNDSSIIFTGVVNDPARYIQLFDYYISFSSAEGLPNAVMEALASGVPVALSSIGPHREFSHLKGVYIFHEQSELISLMRDLVVGNVRVDSSEDVMFDFLNSIYTGKAMSSRYQEVYQDVLYAIK